MRVLATVSLALLIFVALSCGGSSSKPENTGALSGNWQLNLTQNYPPPQTPLSASGFLVESNNTLTGSVQGPAIFGQFGECGGVGPVSGTINGQNVSFSLSPGATVFNFTGAISSDSKSMSGSYQGLGGACFPNPTSGTWTATLVPPLNGTFTGTLASNYMAQLNGSNAPVPVSVSGSFTQAPNVGSSTATLAGTITAVGYPCFTTASLTGTISGQSIYLSIYGYNGVQIGSMGQVQPPGGPPTPATLMVTSAGLVVTDSNPSGFSVNLGNPCPAVIDSFGHSLTTDSGSFTLNVQ